MPIIQISFMYILKISAIKSINASVTTIVTITDRNAGMQNVLNCQITPHPNFMGGPKNFRPK